MPFWGRKSAVCARRERESDVNKKVVIGGVLALLIVGGGGAAGYQFLLAEPADDPAAAEQAAFEAVNDDAPIYIALQPISAPVVYKDRVRYYVQLGVSLQLDSEASKDLVYKQMPRLRDAILRDLHGASVLRPGSKRSINFDGLKSRLLAQAQSVFGAEIVRDVLITRAIGG